MRFGTGVDLWKEDRQKIGKRANQRSNSGRYSNRGFEIYDRNVCLLMVFIGYRRNN